MEKAVGDDILKRLAMKRKSIVDRVIPKTDARKEETKRRPKKPHVFLRKRVERSGYLILDLPDWVEFIGFLLAAAAAVFGFICLGNIIPGLG